MAIVMVGGFGIVIAVNFYMAAHAISGFGGVVVPNSYVASQEFNGWLDKADKQSALGWSAEVTRNDGGNVELSTGGVPDGATVTAMLRRPLGQAETTQIGFSQTEPGRFVSTRPVPGGRWIIRLTITAAGNSWAKEKRIE